MQKVCFLIVTILVASTKAGATTQALSIFNTPPCAAPLATHSERPRVTRLIGLINRIRDISLKATFDDEDSSSHLRAQLEALKPYLQQLVNLSVSEIPLSLIDEMESIVGSDSPEQHPETDDKRVLRTLELNLGLVRAALSRSQIGGPILIDRISPEDYFLTGNAKTDPMIRQIAADPFYKMRLFSGLRDLSEWINWSKSSVARTAIAELNPAQRTDADKFLRKILGIDTKILRLNPELYSYYSDQILYAAKKSLNTDGDDMLSVRAIARRLDDLDQYSAADLANPNLQIFQIFKGEKLVGEIILSRNEENKIKLQTKIFDPLDSIDRIKIKRLAREKQHKLNLFSNK